MKADGRSHMDARGPGLGCALTDAHEPGLGCALLGGSLSAGTLERAGLVRLITRQGSDRDSGLETGIRDNK